MNLVHGLTARTSPDLDFSISDGIEFARLFEAVEVRAHQAVLAAYSLSFLSAAALFEDLQRQTPEGRCRRKIRAQANMGLLCVDEVGYLSFDGKSARICSTRSSTSGASAHDKSSRAISLRTRRTPLEIVESALLLGSLCLRKRPAGAFGAAHP